MQTGTGEQQKHTDSPEERLAAHTARTAVTPADLTLHLEKNH